MLQVSMGQTLRVFILLACKHFVTVTVGGTLSFACDQQNLLTLEAAEDFIGKKTIIHI